MLGRVLLHIASLNLISYSGPALVKADNNFLTGANDVIAVKRSEEGGGEVVDINASPFAVQFGKKDIWLPRSGHQVKVTVNNVPAPSLAMVLDSTGTAYFPTQEQPGGRQYRFWTALLGMGEPAPQHRFVHRRHRRVGLGLSFGLPHRQEVWFVLVLDSHGTRTCIKRKKIHYEPILQVPPNWQH